MREMDAKVYQKFCESRQKLQPIHGRTTQRWARQIASQMNLTDFGASASWLVLIKRRHGVVSRKVTNYIGRAEKDRGPQIAASIVEFGPNFTRESKGFDHEHIYNFDQTGFRYEPANLGTFSHRGERDTHIVLDSKNKNTHSYTVQPMITRSGKLTKKLLIVLQEREMVIFRPLLSPR